MLERLVKRLSYANVIATVALFVALGGGAYAVVQLPRNSVGSPQLKRDAVGASEVRAGAVRSPEVRNGSLRLGDIGAHTRDALRARFSAVVDASGRLVRGNAVQSGKSITGYPGAYSVVFDDDISRCTYAATLATFGTSEAAGRIAVRGQGATVNVQTSNKAGQPADLPFQLIVAC